MISADPHADQPNLVAGTPIQRATAAMILIHGRGASAEDILTLVPEIDVPGFTYIAPQAASSTWYPYSFLSPLDSNEPWLSSALNRIAQLISQVSTDKIDQSKIFLLGFSQGACLATEFAARNPGRYGGIFALSGGLIGPPNMEREFAGDFKGTPVFLGCSDIDPHIPLERVEFSASFFSEQNAQVEKRIYAGMGHTVNLDEVACVKNIMQRTLHAGQ